MASTSGGDFDLFEALCSQPDLLGLVVQQCSGNKNNLRLACSRLRAAVDACVTGLEWMINARTPFASEAKHMAVLARCPRLQTLDFSGRPVADFSPLASCIGLRRVTGLRASDCFQLWQNLASFAALTHLEHLQCSESITLVDISALVACTALKYLDCSCTGISQLPPLPVRLETLICHNTLLTEISALVACTSLKHLDCHGCDITTIPPLHAGCLETLKISGTQCFDLSPLAACAGLRSLDCRFTPVRNLLPLLACKQLEVLDFSNFDGVIDQTNQLIQAFPDLDIVAYESDDDDSEEEDEEDAEDGWDDGGEYDGEDYDTDWDSLSGSDLLEYIG